MAKRKQALSTDPYKGVRDFYPEDMFIEQFLFDRMRDVVEHYGYEEYHASILEPSELYESKSSEEIVSEQTYNFIDRGGRRVTLRPEMTPSVARMVAARRRELSFPLRWYSIPNVFRYERPQRGRLREHWQLNCDLFGSTSIEADVEILLLGYELMRAFGTEEREFEIRLNHRSVIPETLAALAHKHNLPLPKEKQGELIRLMDKRDKLKGDEYAGRLQELLGAKLASVVLKHYTPATIRKLILETHAGRNFTSLLELLEARGIKNVVHDPHMVRGFDYYSGMIFEVYDTAGDMPKALFGGGRYDNLLEVFGEESVPAVGFGLGDVRLREFLATHKRLPDYLPTTDLYMIVVEPSLMEYAQQLAQRLRRRDLTVAVDLSGKKVADQLKIVHKKSIPFALFVGGEERESGIFKLRDMRTKSEISVPEQLIADAVFEVSD